MYTISLTAPDVTKQVQKLSNFDREYIRAARAVAQNTSRLMQSGWKSVAAVESGRYRGSIIAKVRSPASKFVQAVASTSMRSPGGFPYPRALEDSTRYHYRGTGRRGQRTAGQVFRKFKTLTPQFAKALKSLGDLLVKKMKV